MSLSAGEIGRLSGVEETRLDPSLAARLPAQTPGPPWRTRIEAVVWLQRARPAAARVLPAGYSAWPRSVSIGAFIRYLDSPVGPYHEFLACPALLAGAGLRVHVPLIAVDSLPSLHGGRAHWGLPKTLAELAWCDPATGITIRPGASASCGALGVHARGRDWAVSADVRARGPEVPFVLRFRFVQPHPDGGTLRTRASVYGRARLARSTLVGTPGASFTEWLPDGTYRGFLVTGARLHIAAPTGVPGQPPPEPGVHSARSAGPEPNA